jgi:GYF domain 2
VLRGYGADSQAMSENEQQIEWFLARDGRQTGPMTDHELQKIVELGHLRPTDLVWRQGFQDWMPAAKVFPPPPRPAPGANPTRPPAAVGPRTAAALRGMEGANGAGREPRSGLSGASAATASAQTGLHHEPARMREAAQPARDYQASLGQAPQESFEPSGWQNGGDGPSANEPFDDIRMPDAPAARRGVPWLKIMAALVVAVVLGAGAAFWVKGRISIGALTQIFAGATTDGAAPRPAVVKAPKDAGREAGSVATAVLAPSTPAARPSPVPAAPFVPTSFAGGPTEVDASLQQTRVWQVVKREFPDWYGERVKEALRLRANQKDDAAISAELVQALVRLRRDNANSALAASPVHLQAIAATFVENLERLARHSTQACFGFISAGETEPLVLELMRASELSAPLNAQMAAIFEAIGDGRRSPKQHSAAVREDFDALATQLSQRGWGPQDLQLFADARSLSRAAPERVCRMVRDWFVGQLTIKDEAIQLRLLVETLKPVVAG